MEVKFKISYSHSITFNWIMKSFKVYLSANIGSKHCSKLHTPYILQTLLDTQKYFSVRFTNIYSCMSSTKWSKQQQMKHHFLGCNAVLSVGWCILNYKERSVCWSLLLRECVFECGCISKEYGWKSMTVFSIFSKMSVVPFDNIHQSMQYTIYRRD